MFNKFCTLHKLYGKVSRHSTEEDRQTDVNFYVDAQEWTVGEGDCKTKGLPEPKIWEGRFFGITKNDSVKCWINLFTIH